MPRSFTDYCLPQYFSSFASMRAVLLLCSLPFSLLFHLEFKLFYFQLSQLLNLDFPGSSNGKESACNAGDPVSIPGWGRSPGGNGNPLQYSCLENPLERGAWWATVPRVAQSQTYLKQLSMYAKRKQY